MFSLRDILLGVGLPALVSAATLLIGRYIVWTSARPPGEVLVGDARTADGRPRGSWRGPAAIGIGFTAAFVGLIGRPSFPPADSVDWFPYLAMLLGVSGIVDSLWRLPTWGRWINFLIDAGLVVALLAWPLVRNSENPAYVICALAGIVLVLALFWFGVERLSGGDCGWPAVETFCATGLVAITLMLSGSKKLGQLGGMLAATIAPFAVVALFSRKNMLGRGTLPLVMVLVAGLLLCGRSFASLTALNVGMLWTGLIAAQAKRVPPVNRWSEWKQCAIGLATVLTFAGSAAALAAFEFARSMSEYGY